MNVYAVKEFETAIEEDGKIKLPEGVQNDFPSGTEIIVQLTKGKIGTSL